MTSPVSPYAKLEYLDVKVCEGIAVVTLSGGLPGNPLTFEGHREMCDIFALLDRDESVRAVVLTGAGDAFSTGASPSLMRRMGEGDDKFVAQIMSDTRDLVLNGVNFEKPVVTALNGPAVGGPLAFALTADVVVAERQVMISDMHIVTAVVPGDGNVLFWPLAMGLMRAKQYLLTGDAMTAEEAHRFGLVTEIAEKGQSLERAMVFARKFAAMSPFAMRHTKRALNAWLRIGMPAYEASWTGEVLSVAHPDAHAAMTAFADGKIKAPR